ncbi:Uncharacterised protein [Salmonella enterica subsp. arizonae]|uniref:Uncharacterized protein n=1 Tax=Salmonella enterica subsp. arizonae TaxID=59203 RepID=A0A379T454_SALER|nr:Uncharacterised protein [Salmonella enterica subsp. arizonae]
MSRKPPQRRKARARNGVAPYSPRQFAGVQGAQVTARPEAAPPERRLQALVLRHGWKPEGRRRFTGSVHDSPARTPAVKPGTAENRKWEDKNGLHAA